ncbi:MAG: transposase zinc-binding domain-containing protein [Planctomycetota bacterium]
MEELFGVWDERFYGIYGPFNGRIRELCERFIRCGDLHFGFIRLRCANPDCTKKDEKLVPFSCKTRGLCPSCSQRRAIAWAERMVEEVLPVVDYRQLVFTIPRRLRKFFLFDRSLYGDLCRSAYASTREYLRRQAPPGFPKLNKAVPAMIASPQSFGDLLIPFDTS